MSVPATRIRWQVLVWSAMLLVTGALSLATAWASWLPSLVLVLAALVPLLLLLGVTGLGVSRRIATLVLLGLLVLTAYLMSARADTTLLTSLSDAIPLLLTEPRPYDVRADLLVAPVLLTAFLGLMVGLRIRERVRLTAVVSGLLLYVCGALLTAGTGDPWGILGILLLVLIFLGWTLLDEHNEPVSARMGMAGPLAVVGVGLLGSVALTPVSQAFEPRDLVEPPIVEVGAVSPLPQLAAWALNPDVELMRVSGDAVPLRLVTLDSFNGTAWSAATEYVPFGTRIPGQLPAAPRRQEATVEIRLADLGGVWLPVPGAPVSVSDDDALVDPITGTLFQPDLAEDTVYDATGRLDRPDFDTLPDASVPTGDQVRRWLDLPELPYDLAQYSARATAGATTPYERALAIEEAVRGDRRLSKQSRSGSDFARIMTFLFGAKGDAGAGVGTTEQFATAFAIVARDNGLPTRVVVGFEPGDEQPDGSRIVRGRDAKAWPEVYFEGQGWVRFYPSPDRGDAPDRPGTSNQGGNQGGESSTSPSPSASESPSAPATTITPAPEADDDAAGSGGVDLPSPWWLLSAAPLALMLLWLLRRQRAWRHRRRGARGAWSELLDAFALAGLPARRWQSSGQLGRLADEQLAAPAGSRLAAAADRAAFAPDPGAEDRGQVRSDLRLLRRAARRRVPLWRRWWWWFDPRVLGRR